MHLEIPSEGYHFDSKTIKFFEQTYKSKYIGHWAIKNQEGLWTEQPVDVFYNPDPNKKAGHKNYFGLFRVGGSVCICDATSAFNEPIYGILCEDGEVLVSRYRHDYAAKGDLFIDGGRDYTRTSGGSLVQISMINGRYKIKESNKA